MNTNKNTPKLRFKGFTDDWEQRKLGDVANIKTGSRNQQDSVINGKYPFFIRSEKVEKLDTYDFDTEAILVPGDGRIGEIFHYYNGKFALHQRVYKVDDFKGVDAFYLLYLFQCKFKEHALRLNAQGTVPSLRLPMFTEWNIDMPFLQEQIRIGRLLNKIELMITLHQRKLEKLKLAKKALLQKLFPKNGIQFPEIRFKGFTDAWEQRKLLTVLNKIVDYRGRTPKKLGLDWSPTGHLALSALNVKMGYVDKTVDAHYGDDRLYNVWMKDNDLYEGQVLFTTEAPMGNVAQVPDDNKYILSQRTIAFIPDRRVISDNFLAVILSASKCQRNLINRASGGTAKGVSQKTLSEISLDIPQSLSEQDKVSELIKKLSKIITLHQRKLDRLISIKKGLLQQLFV